LLKKVLEVDAVRSMPYLVAKPFQVGVVGLAYRFFGSGRFFLA
jgi:hypothetical protein